MVKFKPKHTPNSFLWNLIYLLFLTCSQKCSIFELKISEKYSMFTLKKSHNSWNLDVSIFVNVLLYFFFFVQLVKLIKSSWNSYIQNLFQDVVLWYQFLDYYEKQRCWIGLDNIYWSNNVPLIFYFYIFNERILCFVCMVQQANRKDFDLSLTRKPLVFFSIWR